MKKENGNINIVKILLIFLVIILAFFILYKVLFEDRKYYTVVNGEITKSQIENSYTEDDAKQKATLLLNAFTNGEYTVENVLITQYIKDGEPYWQLENQNYEIKVNSITNKVIYYKDKYDITQIQNTKTEEEAKNILNSILEKYNIPDEYELALLENDEITGCLWYAKLCIKEDGIFNEYKMVELDFIPEINRVISMTYKDYKYTNNEIIITQEQAEQIAKSTYGEQDISKIETKRSITQMIDKKVNSEIYLGDELEITDKSEIIQYMEKFKESREIRNVWQVIITNNYGDTAEYAIDATTGNIVRKAYARNN